MWNKQQQPTTSGCARLNTSTVGAVTCRKDGVMIGCCCHASSKTWNFVMHHHPASEVFHAQPTRKELESVSTSEPGVGARSCARMSRYVIYAVQ